MFKSLQAMIALLAAANLFAPAAAALDLNGTKWIWTSTGRMFDGTYPVGNSTFRKDFSAPMNKTPLSVDVVIDSDDKYTLYYNGKEVGTGANHTMSQLYCVPMTADPSVFAVIGENLGGAAGILAAMNIKYLDGTNETIVTDATWRGIVGVPSGSLAVSFNDSAWPAAYVEGAFPNTSPWYGQVSIPAAVTPPSVTAPMPTFPSASWIWTNQYAQNLVGARAFRKTLMFPEGEYVNDLVVDIVADDAYTLYMNGKVVGTGTNYKTAQRWHVKFAPTSQVVLAVYAQNGGGPTGLLVSGVLQGCACGCGNPTMFKTDATWKYSNTIPAGFIEPEFNDSTWAAASVEGAYGIAPWGNIPSPTVASSPNAPLSGAPSAPTATVIV